MARNGSGTYTSPTGTWNPAVTGTVIDATDWNTLRADYEAALTASLAKDGQTPATARIPFASGVQTDSITEVTAANGITIAKVNAARGTDVASAATINLTTATGQIVDVTGVVTITAVTLADGSERLVRFTGALTLTHGASLVLPGTANITTAAGDYALFVGYAASVVRCAFYVKATGKAVIETVTSVTGTAPIASSGGATPAISLDNAGVTLAKMANLAQDAFIIRTTASTGVPETATCTAVARTVLDDVTTAAMLTTLGALPLAGGTMTGDITMTAASTFQAEGAVVASAGTTDIWAVSDGDTVHISGTTTITSLGTAPQAGAMKRLIFDGALTLTHGVNLNLPGSVNYVTAADDVALVYADTTIQFDVLIFKKDGTPVVGVTSVATAGLAAGGPITATGTVTVSITAQTGETAPAVGDELAVYDISAAAHRKMTLENALKVATESFIVAVSDETTALTTGVAKVTFRMPYAFVVTGVRASLTTASTSGLPAIDINEAGLSILSTTITIDANELTSQTAVTPPVISDSALADDASMTIDIDAAGTGAKGLKVTIIGRKV